MPTLLERVLDRIADGVILADADARVTFVNAAAARMHGVADTDVPVERWGEAYGLLTMDGRPYPPEEFPLARAALRGEEVADARWRIRRADGTEVVAEGTASPLLDEAGRRVGAVLVVRDVTERARLHASIRARDERARGLAAATPVGLFEADLLGHVADVNAKIVEIWGRPAASLLGRGWVEGVHPADRHALLTAWADANAAGRDYEHEFRIVRPDGSVRVLRGRSAVTRDEHGAPMGTVGSVEDVTEQRRAAASARLLQALTAAFSAVLTPEEVVGVALEEVVEGLGARTGLLALVEPGAGPDGDALRLLGARGYPADALERFRRIPLDGAMVSAAVARTGEPVWLTEPEATVRRYPAAAETYAALALQATAALPLVDGRGRPFGVLVFNFDAPRAFDGEERALIAAVARQCAQALERARLFEAERAAREEAERARRAAEEANAAKSRFLATTSHEVRTPINAILGYAELLEMGLAGPLTDEQHGYLTRVRVSGRHLLSVVNQVLDLAKIEADRVELHPEPARAAAVAGRAAALLESQATARHVALANACGAADVAYVGDAERVEQVLVNLLTNAVKFTPAGGRVTLSCGHARHAPREAAVTAEAPQGWMYFRVEDTGIGIPAERLRAIWEPFEQAEVGHTRAYGGTGLGLTISRRLARLMGGDVTVRSVPGQGSAFFLWLPATSAETAPDGEQAAPEDRRRGATRYARGLHKAADAALGEIERVLSGYAERLRTDAQTPSARAFSDADLEDHAASFLADMAQCLTVIEDARGAPSESMRDASAIQRVIAERHGAQRARLGWGAAEVRREFAILREELAAAVRRRVGREPDVEVDQALALFAGFIEHAERASLATHAAPPAPER